MKKKKLVAKLNNDVLFNTRKMYSMYANVQLHVTDVSPKEATVEISSLRIDFGETKHNGNVINSKEQISKNIKEAVERQLPGQTATVTWRAWKPSHGYGFMLELKRELFQ